MILSLFGSPWGYICSIFNELNVLFSRTITCKKVLTSDQCHKAIRWTVAIFKKSVMH